MSLDNSKKIETSVNSISTSNYNQRARAAEYIAREWSPIPVKFTGEEPIPPNWRDLRFGLDDIDRWFPDEPTNIGVLLGGASGDLVEVHFVDEDALRLADQFLPDTKMKFGSTSRRRSHWLYMVYDADYEDADGDCSASKWTASGIGTLMELRGDGQYSVFPGSIVGGRSLFGKSGEPIVFDEEEFPPGATDRLALTDGLNLLAIATLLFKKWEPPHRLSLANSMARFLQGCAWQGPTQTIIASVAKAAGADERGVRNHLAAVQATFETPRRAGLSGLARCLGEEAARDIQNWQSRLGRGY